MKLIRTAVLSLALLATACGESRVYISGDAEAIDAAVFDDGEKAGRLEKIAYVGSTSSDPVVLSRERKLQANLGVQPGAVYASAELRLKPGKHRILVISNDQRRLEIDLEPAHESYLSVNFSRMLISRD